MSAAVALVVIAKAPCPGRVKTRLCPPCTPRQAAALAEAALADTLDTVLNVPAARPVIALDGRPGPWLPADFAVVPQVGTGLGERLANAFAAVGGPAFVVGMDTPHLTAGTLAAAIDLLLRPGTDAVLGPAVDGGWWGLGLRRPDTRVFDRVEMSTPSTGARQLRRLAELRLRTRLLPSVRDVDDFADALAVADIAPASRFARTVRTLEPDLSSPAVR